MSHATRMSEAVKDMGSVMKRGRIYTNFRRTFTAHFGQHCSVHSPYERTTVNLQKYGFIRGGFVPDLND